MSELECEFCKQTFAAKYVLKKHQKRAKYCLSLQGIESTIEFNCDFCLKKLSTKENLNSHLQICKKKKSTENDDIRKELETQKNEYEEKLQNLKKEYEEKLEKQKKEYEEKIEKERNVINQIAMKPKTVTTNISNMNTLNFNDKEKLNNVIKRNINQNVVEKGQIGIADVVYNKYLKDEQGNQLYILLDAARQNFQFRDQDGNIVTDIGAKLLTDAVASSDLEKETSRIAKDVKDLYLDREKFENIMSLTGEFKKDNSTFRKEIVHLVKKDQKTKKTKK